jgi:hypothetical protein
MISKKNCKINTSLQINTSFHISSITGSKKTQPPPPVFRGTPNCNLQMESIATSLSNQGHYWYVEDMGRKFKLPFPTKWIPASQVKKGDILVMERSRETDSIAKLHLVNRVNTKTFGTTECNQLGQPVLNYENKIVKERITRQLLVHEGGRECEYYIIDK